jgi:hypothetical protein
VGRCPRRDAWRSTWPDRQAADVVDPEAFHLVEYQLALMSANSFVRMLSDAGRRIGCMVASNNEAVRLSRVVHS